MIVPMKKITLVVLEHDREEALASLRKTGVLHIERREASSTNMAELQAFVTRLEQAHSILSEIKPDKKKVSAKKLGREHTLELVERVFALRSGRQAALESIVRIEAELERLSPWGDVDPATFGFLAERGIYLLPFTVQADEYALIPETVRCVPVGRDKKAVRFLIWSDTDAIPAGLPPSAAAFALPAKSTEELAGELESARKAIPAADAHLASEAVHAASILSLKAEAARELEFETIRASMPVIALGEESVHTRKASVAWLTGFVPAPDEHAIAAGAKKHGWAFVSEDPSEEDNVPTQIKNNRFVNLISPLIDFLGTVPGYREIDISLWFLLFFGIFFAMIFGDGGYGTLLALVSSYYILTSIVRKQKVATGLYMFLYLALMTVAWGIATCSWFGLPFETLPVFLQSIAIPAFSNGNPESATNIKIFCFVLGLVQLSLAHVIGMIRNFRTVKVLGELGSLLMTIGMFFVVLNLVIDAERFPMSDLVLGTIGAGFVLNFMFINYSGSIGGGILESFKNIITMFLGVVNVFGDIMSYIRLWAVGLAGAAISGTINAMAGDFMGGLIIFAGLLLLLFGHGLNLMMNVLSVVVHGVRLNTLEFSNHLGLTWSGFKYEPFSETVKK